MAGEKRSADDASEVLHQESVILLDVEGTTSSISFVQDTLFPYIREFLKKHVDEKWSTDEFKADLAKLKEQAKEDEEKKVDGFVPIKEDTEAEAKETLMKNVLWQMDSDRKTGALKQLQGHMWKAAHKPIKGHVYDDVPKAFEEWTSMGKKLYIYSSGSVEAQKLLYGESVHGDLLKYISGHFDTTIGPKQEADSYKNILKEINLEPSKVLFLTDVVKEAQAAKEAGLATTIVIREGNAKLTDEDKAAFKTIESFAELHFQSASKRPKLTEDEESKKKEAPKEDAVVTESNGNEPMDTSEDVKVSNVEKKVDTKTDEKVVESKVEKVVAAEKSKVTENSGKEVTPMEEDTKSEKKTDADAKTENLEKSTEEKKEVISSDEKQTAGDSNAEKKSVELEKKETIEAEEKKSVEVAKEADKVSPSEEKTLITEVPEKNENGTEKVTEKVTDKIVDSKADDIEKEPKSDEKEVKENGESKLKESEQNNKSVDSKVEETENKENVQSENIEDKTESKTESAEEKKETTTVENSGEKKEKDTEKISNVDSETAPEKTEVKSSLNGTSTNGDSAKNDSDEKVHTNGVDKKTEKTKENDESEESIKVKKAIADGAGETDVVVPPVVAATS